MKTNRFRKLLFCGVWLMTGAIHAVEYRIEPERTMVGDWEMRQYQQTVQQSYFVPKNNNSTASGTFTVPVPGKYAIWLRVESRNGGFRKTTVFLDGRALGDFGDEECSQNGWYWRQVVKDVNLTGDSFKLGLAAKSKYARVDSIILSDDPAYLPPDDPREAEKIKLLPGAEKSPVPPPAVRGQGGEVLIFAGGRPWTANDTAEFFASAGCRVTCLDSRHLAGFGSASTKNFPTDLEEPPKRDDITPVFQSLDRYKLFVLGSIPARYQAAMLTPERIAALKNYVASGGSLLVDAGVPETLGELLPVQLGESVAEYAGLKVVPVPGVESFKNLPESWACYGEYRRAGLIPGAQLLARLTDAGGREAGAFAAVHSYGKGRVVFYNDAWFRHSRIRQLYDWAYGRALLVALAREASRLPLRVESAIYPLPPLPQPRNHQKLTVAVARPVIRLEETTETPVLSADGRQITFANGCTVGLDRENTVTITWPGRQAPVIRNLAVPQPVFSGKPEKLEQHLTGGVAEAVVADQRAFRSTGTVWNYLAARQNDDHSAAFMFRSPDGAELTWNFKAGSLKLDGREYLGVADSAAITRAPYLLELISFDAELVFPDGNAGCRARRMSCYARPRGYCDYNLDRDSAADTGRLQFFCSGQPFTYVVSGDGIYTDFVADPVPVFVSLSKQAGEESVRRKLQLMAGRRRAPLTLPYVWHLYSAGAERGVNDYMALYQFQRLNLRARTGIASFPNFSYSTYSNTCTPAEADLSVKASVALHFERVMPPWCPSALEWLDGEKSKQTFQILRAAGTLPMVWSAGDYCHGDSEMLFREHQDYFLKDANGNIQQYFGKFPVLDLNHPGFRKWYAELMERMFANGGNAGIYQDMGGQASQNVNYGTSESGPGLDGLIERFKFFSRHQVPFAIEGMNPLAFDSFWYRQKLYNSFVGREFALQGMQIWTSVGDALVLDYFRLRMYNTTVQVDVSGYANRFERVPGELERIAGFGPLNRIFAEASRFVGYPFVRETEFGTMWIGAKNAALFFCDNVNELDVELPEGWRLVGHSGSRLKNLKAETILLIEGK